MLKIVNYIRLYLFIIALLLLVLFSCKRASNKYFSSESNNDYTTDEMNTIKEQLDEASYRKIDSSILYKAHLESMRKEKIQIDDFIRRYRWNMKITPTGLYYMIYHHGSGRQVKKGDIVLMEYEITFLNGDLVYSSQKEGIKEFEIAHSDEISGLEEGLLLMHKGDRARLIVPSFLAYGVTGDFNKISIKNTLVYNIYLVDLK